MRKERVQWNIRLSAFIQPGRTDACVLTLNNGNAKWRNFAAILSLISKVLFSRHLGDVSCKISGRTPRWLKCSITLQDLHMDNNIKYQAAHNECGFCRRSLPAVSIVVICYFGLAFSYVRCCPVSHIPRI
jgi:hypothetical protein